MITIINFSKYLSNNGLPIYWQWIVLINIVLSTSLLFLENNILYHATSIVIILLSMYGFGYQFTRKKHSLSIWGFLFLGIIFIKVSLLMIQFDYFGLNVNKQILFWIEQSGILLITIFAFSIMILFEKKFQQNGFTADFTLFVIALVILYLLASPKFLNNLIFHYELTQQLLITKLLFGFIMLTMSIFLHFVTKKVVLHNIFLTLTVLLIISHFLIDLLSSLHLLNIDPKISATIYHLSGITVLLFIFTEKISVSYHAKNSYAVGSTFMWIASITAISVIPLSILLRWYQDQEPIDSSIIGFSSLILSSMVIWRLIIFIKNTQIQGRNLKKIAYTDPLTYLPNYHGLIEKIDSNQLGNTLVIAIDIDGFRSINDLYGRSFGDDVLISLAKRLKSLPGVITASRAGTDLFIIVYREKHKDIHNLVQNIQKKLGIWVMVSGKRIAVPLTLGVSHSKNQTNPQILIQQAEAALSNAKINHERFSIYYKSKSTQLPRHKLREIMQQAIDLDYLPVHFQPIYSLENGSLTAMELLIRIESKETGILMPGQFLEEAEAYGLLTPLTKICVSMIARNYHKLPDVIINLNLPSYILSDANILNEFLTWFKDAKLSSKRFCIEVMEDQDIPPENLIKSVKQLKKMGFSIAMDDFGTGYSSLSRLSMLPFDTVKIDRSLLLAASAGNKTILESAIKLIKRLNLSTVVEGVETIEQLALIRKLGANSVQGYLLSKPVDINKTKDFPLIATNIIGEC